MRSSEGKVESVATVRLIASEVIFGTLGLFVRLIPLSSPALAASRGVVGALVLVAFAVASKRRLPLPREGKTLALLVASGVCLALNWALLFEAYRLTTLATAELAYEMAPVFVMAVAPFVLGEHLTSTRMFCMALALAGIVCVSGVLEPGAMLGVTPTGIAFGLGAACFYAAVMVLGQLLDGVDDFVVTVVQLGVAGVALLPLSLGGAGWTGLTLQSSLLLLVVCVLHTGVAFILWFSAMGALPAQKIAVFNYIDPTVALLTSALVFGERLSPIGMLGAVLILGSTGVSELLEATRRRG